MATSTSATATATSATPSTHTVLAASDRLAFEAIHGYYMCGLNGCILRNFHKGPCCFPILERCRSKESQAQLPEPDAAPPAPPTEAEAVSSSQPTRTVSPLSHGDHATATPKRQKTEDTTSTAAPALARRMSSREISLPARLGVNDGWATTPAQAWTASPQPVRPAAAPTPATGAPPSVARRASSRETSQPVRLGIDDGWASTPAQEWTASPHADRPFAGQVAVRLRLRGAHDDPEGALASVADKAVPAGVKRKSVHAAEPASPIAERGGKLSAKEIAAARKALARKAARKVAEAARREEAAVRKALLAGEVDEISVDTAAAAERGHFRATPITTAVGTPPTAQTTSAFDAASLLLVFGQAPAEGSTHGSTCSASAHGSTRSASPLPPLPPSPSSEHNLCYAVAAPTPAPQAWAEPAAAQFASPAAVWQHAPSFVRETPLPVHHHQPPPTCQSQAYAPAYAQAYPSAYAPSYVHASHPTFAAPPPALAAHAYMGVGSRPGIGSFPYAGHVITTPPAPFPPQPYERLPPTPPPATPPVTTVAASVNSTPRRAPVVASVPSRPAVMATAMAAHALPPPVAPPQAHASVPVQHCVTNAPRPMVWAQRVG